MKNYENMINSIRGSRYILIITHINPDPDTISSALALSNYLFENNIKHKVFNKEGKLPFALNFLSRFDKISDQLPKFYDLVIYLDCGDKFRAGDMVLDNNAKVINIDHHQSNDNFGDINIVDDKKASTAEVLYECFEYNNMNISKKTAECLYVGIYDDSIAFTTPRTNARTFEIVNKLAQTGISIGNIANNLLRRDSLARYRIMPKILATLELHSEGKLATVYLDDNWLSQTGADISDCDDVVNMILNIAVVNVVAYFRIKNNKVRVSLRSKGDFDVSKVAESYNGGGHKNAAGLSMDTLSIDEAKELLIENVKTYI
ncbi:MAG: bifunctional oligoribonuclease/PAP phosphatase NrnA [Campylobacterota bacterium]|nr:bifunctional oligoribonuclease/PAP phosphatase NrnA [Campylobacterota bacterium]